MSDYGTGNSAAGDLALAQARIRELEAQLAEARAERDEWRGGFAEASGTVTRNPRRDLVDYVRGARSAAKDAALEEAAKEVERYRDPRFADDSAEEGNAFFTDAARAIRALKTVTPPTE